MAGDRNVVIRLRGDIGDFQAKMVAASKSVGAVTDKLTGTEKESARLRQGLTTVGDAAGKMGLAAAAGVGLVTKAAMDWETAWAGVTKTVEGTPAQMAELEDSLRELARTLPATHTEIAAVAEAAGQLGIQRESVAEFTETMIALGETTNLSAEEAATSIARFSNIMGTSADEVERIGSAIVDLGNNSATTEAEILEMGTRLAAAGAIAGLAESDVLAFASTLTSVGVEAEAGGTALSKVFTSVRDAAIDGGEKLQTFADVAGVSASEFQQAFAQDAAGAVELFIAGLGRMNAAGESTTAIFNSLSLTDQRLMRALLSTAEAGDLLADSLTLGNEAWEENTALAIEAAKRYETTASQTQVAWNNIKDAAIEFGEVALPVLAGAADKVAGFAQAIGSLPAPVKSATTGLLGITAVLGSGLWFTSKVINGVTEMRTGLENLGVSGAKASKAMKGVGIAAAALASVTIIDSLQRQADEALPGLEALTKQLIELSEAGAAQALSEEFDSLGDSLDRMFDKNAAQKLEDFLGSKIGVSDSRLDEAKAEVEALDTALANLVSTGNAETAAKALDNLIRSQGLNADQAGALRDALGQYDEALLAVENDATLAAKSGDEFADSLGDLGDAAGETAEEVLELDDAMSVLFGGLDYDAAIDSWKDSIKGFSAELKGGSGALDRNTEAGRENREAIRSQIEELRAMAEAEYEVTGDTEKLRQTLLKGREAIIAQAEAADIGRDEMEKYLRVLGLTPKQIRTVVELMGANEATDDVNDLNNALSRLPAYKLVTIEAQRRGNWSGSGPGFADGGFTGYGGKYEPAGIVHRGEFVFDAQTTAMFRPFFEELHRTRRMPGYADGGFVRQISGPSYTAPSSVNLSAADIDRLAQAMSRVRPLYGDVNVADGRDFVRTLEQDRHRAALEGRR